MLTPHVRFRPIGAFHVDLKQRVARHFGSAPGATHANWAMRFKTVVLLAWLVLSYSILMFTPVAWWQAVLLTISIGLAQAGIGFAVMHDANHGVTPGALG